MREGLSQTVDITCMPSVTASNSSISVTTLLCSEIIICKWEINGVDHYYNETQATTDCTNIGYSLGLWSTGYIPTYRTTPTNDSAMLTKYIDSSVCGR